MQERLELLRRAGLFDGLSDDDLSAVLEGSETLEFPDRTRLFAQGDVADGMYVLLDGRVVISKREGGVVERTLATLEPVSVFGEMALVLGTARQASVYAEGPVRLLRIPAARWEELLGAGGSVAMKLLRNVARGLGARVARLNDQLLATGRQAHPAERGAIGDLRDFLAKEWGL